jgi:hypothetical protein
LLRCVPDRAANRLEESSFPVVDRLEIANELEFSTHLSGRAATDAFKWSRKNRDRRLIIE